MYRTFIYQRYGFLGKGYHVRLGNCVENKIRQLFLSDNGECVGFQSGDGSVGEEDFWPFYYGKHYGEEFEDIPIDWDENIVIEVKVLLTYKTYN